MNETISEGLTVIDGGRSGEVSEVPERVSTITGSKQWASKIRRRAKELSETLDIGYLEMARILHQVWDTPVDGDTLRGPIYTSWGHTSFGDYSEKELGIPRKKAERLRLIWYTLEIQLRDMPPELKDRVTKLGYSKVRELIRVLTLRNAEMWIEQAENLSYTKLYATIQDEKRRQALSDSIIDGKPKESPEDTITGEDILNASTEEYKKKSFSLAPSQMENVLLALQKCASISGSDKEGHLLDLICTDFIATNDVMGSDTDKKLRYLAKIERVLGLRLVAVDPDAKEIVYGLTALEMVRDAE